MWGFTKQEQRAIIFLLAVFGAGCALLYYHKAQPAPPISVQHAEQLSAFVESVKRDSLASEPSPVVAADMRPRGRLDLNQASYQELMELPGIGPVMAQRILEYRARTGGFSKVEELAEVKGVGAKRVEKLRAYVEVR